MNPILSIAIPTHNRSQYAIHTLRSLQNIGVDNFEVIISDTSSDGKLFELINNNNDFEKDTRFKYFQPINCFDMSSNLNYALSKCTGKYVICIGDDDSICNDALQAVELASQYDIDVISPNVSVVYCWSDFKHLLYGLGHASRLYVPRNIKKSYYKSPQVAKDESMKFACQGTDGLPKLYHGFVKRELLETIREKTGNYVHGSSPDVSSAISISLFAKNMLITNYPLTIPGASGGSNTGRAAVKKHVGKIEDESQTKSFIDKGWTIGIPKFFSVETVWAHSALESVRLVEYELIKKFNYAHLFALCYINHKTYKKEIDLAINDYLSTYKVDKSDFIKEIKKEKFIILKKKLIYLFKRIIIPTPAGGKKYFKNISNIEEAKKCYESFKEKKGWNVLSIF